MDMNMHEKDASIPTITVVREASLLICQTNFLVATFLKDQHFSICSWIEYWRDGVSAS